jgi:hypothetical protein
METPSTNLHMYQKTLDGDSDMKSSFLHAENNDSDSDSESEKDTCKIVIPRSKKKNSDTSQELLFQLIRQNQVLSTTHKKMYKLQSELDKEEITTRFIKLDLNNTQVKLDETNDNFKECKKQLQYAHIENWTTRFIMLLYILVQLYCFTFNMVESFSQTDEPTPIDLTEIHQDL